MKTRIELHAEFSNRCASSLAAYKYIQNVIDAYGGVEYERKLTRRSTPNGFFVHLSLLWDKTVDCQDDAENLLDEIHAAALGSHGYEHMELIDFELVDTQPVH